MRRVVGFERYAALSLLWLKSEATKGREALRDLSGSGGNIGFRKPGFQRFGAPSGTPKMLGLAVVAARFASANRSTNIFSPTGGDQSEGAGKFDA